MGQSVDTLVIIAEMKKPVSPARQRGGITMSNTVRRISQSEMTTWMRCPRKHNLAYKQGLKPIAESSKLSLGTLVHQALKEHYRGGDAVLFLREEQVADDMVRTAEGNMEPNPEMELALIMVEGYMEWLEETGADVGHEIIICEEELELDMGDFILHGTPDLLWRSPDGLLTLVDHKTVASFGSLTDRRLQLNFQLQTYTLMWWKLTGERPDSICLNMLRKVKRTAAAKPPFYAREFVHFNEAQLVAHEGHIRQVMAAMERRDVDYPVPSQDCTYFCEFLTPCTMMDENPTGAQEMLNELYVHR